MPAKKKQSLDLWHRTPFYLLLAVLVLAPLPFGAARPWAWSLLAVLVGIVLAILALAQLAVPARTRVPWQVAVAALTTLLVWGWVLVQAWPGAVGLASWLTAHPVWHTAAEDGIAGVPTVAADPWAALSALMRLAAYGGTFWAAFLLAQRSGRARLLLMVLLGAMAVYAVYGLVVLFLHLNTILWIDKWAYRNVVTSTFVNRNSFATYANLGILISLGLIAETFLSVRSINDFRRVGTELMKKLLGPRGVLIFAFLLLITAMLLTGSRGGLLSLLGATAFLLFIVFLVMRPKLRTALTTLAIVVVVVGALLTLSGSLTLSRLDTVDSGTDIDISSAGRFSIWQLSLDMIAQRPWLGHGYGSFLDMFYLNRDDRFTVIFDMAHDTYIEHLVELGIPATILLYTGPVLLFGMCVRGVFNRRRDQVVPLVASSATVLVGLHSLVDFSLQIPAVAVTYAAILGAGCAQAMRSEPTVQTGRSRGRSLPAPDLDVTTLPPATPPPRPAALPPGPGGIPQPTEA